MIVDENLNDCSDEVIAALNKTRKNLGIWIGIAMISIFLLLYGMIVRNKQDKLLHKLNTQLEQEEQMLSLEYSIGYWFINTPEEINDSTLYQFLLDNNAWYPDILLKQAKIESGNYKSNIYVNSCNLYGMRKVGKRNTTQRGVYNGYGVYDNWCLSVLDRMLWDVFYFKNEKPAEEEYLKAMSIYAEDSDYISKIK